MTIKRLRELDEKSILSDEDIAIIQRKAGQLSEEQVIQLINFIGVASGKIRRNQVS